MITKILVGSLLALSAVSTVAGNVYIYKDKDGKQVLLNNVSPSVNFNKPATVVAKKDNYLSAAQVKIFNAELNAEIQALKNDIKIARSGLAKQNLKNTQEERKRQKGVLTPTKSEVALTVSIDSIYSVDVGAKIGMTKEEVLNKTYWGKPNDTHEVTDEYGKLESWSYSNDRGTQYLFFDNNRLIRVYG